jgi:LTXXQ motif family protein
MEMKRILLAAAVSSAFAVAPVAFAEMGDAGNDAVVVAQAAQQRTPEGAGAQRQAPARRFTLPSERVEARLAYARTALKITDSQQSQWENFANVLRKHARAMDQRIQQRRAQFDAARSAQGERVPGARRPDGRQVTAIERLERTQQRMAERSARLTEVIAAAKPLYASLTSEQKQVADGMFAHRGHGGQRQHFRGMHRGPSA